jgi:hypothetical protein
MKLVGLILLIVMSGACSRGAVDAEPPSGAGLSPAGALPAEPTSGELERVAEDICTRSGWVGIAEPPSFTVESTALGVSDQAVEAAVRRHCPDTFYEPLTTAEVDWCGNGHSFGRNYFKVIAAGVDLGIESFAVVEGALVTKAANGIDLTDYEIELLTAELQTMSESSRFERDWAEACRTTY